MSEPLNQHGDSNDLGFPLKVCVKVEFTNHVKVFPPRIYNFRDIKLKFCNFFLTSIPITDIK